MITLAEHTYDLAQAGLKWAIETGQGDTFHDIAKRAFHAELRRLANDKRSHDRKAPKTPRSPGRPPTKKAAALGETLLKAFDALKQTDPEGYQEKYGRLESAIKQAVHRADMPALEWFSANRPWLNPEEAVLPDFIPGLTDSLPAQLAAER